ncbi:hypothetical protein FJZ23_00675 [Candidatus Parcubacteria bacterium]|nr:hypothetical protein [Candidatus Parcubacteria bacterium]
MEDNKKSNPQVAKLPFLPRRSRSESVEVPFLVSEKGCRTDAGRPVPPPTIVPRPERSKPQRRPQEKPLTSNLGQKTLAELESAIARGDERAKHRAIEAGLALGLDHPAIREERERRDREAQKDRRKALGKFNAALKAARSALQTAWLLEGEKQVEAAITKVRHQSMIAFRCDPDRRQHGKILALIGTDQDTLEALPYLTLTAVPDQKGICGTVERRRRSRRAVASSPCAAAPIRQIAQGECLTPRAPAKIRYEGAEVVLHLPGGERYRMERDPEFGWIYSDLSDPDIGLLRVFERDTDGVRRATGFTREPPQSGILLEARVREPLFIIVHEYGAERFCFVAARMDTGLVEFCETSWSEELLTGDLVEIARGFAATTKDKEIASAS